jgi:hypothetical protein
VAQVQVRWEWERTDPNRNGSSGDLAKLFRNETVKQPGVLANGAPPAHATLMAREVIQNSWDAAREHTKRCEEIGLASPDFEIEFAYAQLTGEEKRKFTESLDLESLATRSANPQFPRPALGLGPDDCLMHLDTHRPLRLLQIRESGTTGMYGKFSGASSKLFLALISVGYTVKDEGSGGSYGYGKAGLIRGSSIRTVVAYTCFRGSDSDELPDGSQVTRRLLGMTYWGQHGEGDDSFTGFARFGSSTTDGTAPFTNTDADDVAVELGIALRDANNEEDLGTTFLLVDPTVEPNELLKAIERNWWPALHEGRFTVLVTDDNGETSVPRPKQDSVLASFVRAYELATTPQDNSVPYEASLKLNRMEIAGAKKELGALGLVADLTGWSYPDDNAEYSESDDDDGGAERIDPVSLVALIRSPLMTVEYLPCGSSVPLVRGAFVAGDDVDDLLRQTEPKQHDAWESNIVEGGIDPNAPRVAKRVIETIKRKVGEFRRGLKPPQPRAEDVRLPILQDLISRVMNGKGTAKKPPPAEARPFKIGLDQRAVASGADRVALQAKAEFALSEHVSEEFADVEIRIDYRFVEDERQGASCPITVTAPSDFSQLEANVWVGPLGHDPVSFSIVSDPYDSDWTGRLVASGSIVDGSPTSVDLMDRDVS